jgi:hypothetical protein
MVNPHRVPRVADQAEPEAYDGKGGNYKTKPTKEAASGALTHSK